MALMLLAGCASPSGQWYSLRDPEIYRSPRTHPLGLAVAVFSDARPVPDDAGVPLAPPGRELLPRLTLRVIHHLRTSEVFDQVRFGPVFSLPPPSEDLRDLALKDIDLLMTGEVTRFSGRAGSEGDIEGEVRLSRLRLFSTHTGRLVWEGEADKRIGRREKTPGGDEQYAVEALRGAVNLLALKLAGRPFSLSEVYGPGRTVALNWGVGVLYPEDVRPDVEKDTAERKRRGDPDFPLHTDLVESVSRPFICGVILVCSPPKREAAPFIGDAANEWVRRLQEADIFGSVRTVESRGGSVEELRQWAEEGLEAVVTSRLSHAYASVVPPNDPEPFPLWSGGVAYPRRFKATALTRIQDVKLIETRTGRVLWEGEAEFGIDRTLDHWSSPVDLARESLERALDRLVANMARFGAAESGDPRTAPTLENSGEHLGTD